MRDHDVGSRRSAGGQFKRVLRAGIAWADVVEFENDS